MSRKISNTIDIKICKNCQYSLFDHMEHVFDNCRACPVENKKNQWYIGVFYAPWKMTNLEYLEWCYDKKD